MVVRLVTRAHRGDGLGRRQIGRLYAGTREQTLREHEREVELADALWADEQPAVSESLSIPCVVELVEERP